MAHQVSYCQNSLVAESRFHRFTLALVHTVARMTTHECAGWKKEEGIASVDDQFIQKYLGGREDLIAREQSQRHGQSRLFPCHFSNCLAFTAD